MRQDISKVQLFKENGWNFQTFKGSIDTDCEPEYLLPLGMKSKDEKSSKVQSNNQNQEPALYPIFVEIED